jgi:hypothetical protein
MVLNRRLIGASLSFFELTRLSSKNISQWSLLLCFFRLSKYEKPSILPSLGSLNLHRRTLPLCVLLTAFAYPIHQPCNKLLLRLNTFGPQRIFSEYHFTRTSVLSLCLELVCLQHSFLPCNVIFLYSFSTIIENNKKKNIPQKEEGKSIFFISSIMSRPWIKHIYPFVHQNMGHSTTLGSFFSLYRVVSSIIWLSFQTYGEFASPPSL